MRLFVIGVAALVAACGTPTETVSNSNTKSAEAPISSEQAPVTEAQRETFGALADLVGKRFRGAPADGSTEPNPDTQSWEWALGGSAILIKHALADGSYGGDTYVYKDMRTEDLVYVYITNAGFRTEGVMVVNEDGSYTAEEAVEGHPTITKVRSTSVLNEDGTSSMTSEYFDAGEWKPGHAFIYSPTAEPLPTLKTPIRK